MELTREERQFLEEVVFSEENQRRDFELFIAHMEEDYANSLSCQIA